MSNNLTLMNKTKLKTVMKNIVKIINDKGLNESDIYKAIESKYPGVTMGEPLGNNTHVDLCVVLPFTYEPTLKELEKFTDYEGNPKNLTDVEANGFYVYITIDEDGKAEILSDFYMEAYNEWDEENVNFALDLNFNDKFKIDITKELDASIDKDVAKAKKVNVGLRTKLKDVPSSDDLVNLFTSQGFEVRATDGANIQGFYQVGNQFTSVRVSLDADVIMIDSETIEIENRTVKDLRDILEEAKSILNKRVGELGIADEVPKFIDYCKSKGLKIEQDGNVYTASLKGNDKPLGIVINYDVASSNVDFEVKVNPNYSEIEDSLSELGFKLNGNIFTINQRYSARQTKRILDNLLDLYTKTISKKVEGGNKMVTRNDSIDYNTLLKQLGFTEITAKGNEASAKKVLKNPARGGHGNFVFELDADKDELILSIYGTYEYAHSDIASDMMSNGYNGTGANRDTKRINIKGLNKTQITDIIKAETKIFDTIVKNRKPAKKGIVIKSKNKDIDDYENFKGKYLNVVKDGDRYRINTIGDNKYNEMIHKLLLSKGYETKRGMVQFYYTSDSIESIKKVDEEIANTIAEEDKLRKERVSKITAKDSTKFEPKSFLAYALDFITDCISKGFDLDLIKSSLAEQYSGKFMIMVNNGYITVEVNPNDFDEFLGKGARDKYHRVRISYQEKDTTINLIGTTDNGDELIKEIKVKISKVFMSDLLKVAQNEIGAYMSKREDGFEGSKTFLTDIIVNVAIHNDSVSTEIMLKSEFTFPDNDKDLNKILKYFTTSKLGKGIKVIGKVSASDFKDAKNLLINTRLLIDKIVALRTLSQVHENPNKFDTKEISARLSGEVDTNVDDPKAETKAKLHLIHDEAMKEQLLKLQTIAKKLASDVDADKDINLFFLEEPKEFKKYKLPTVALALVCYDLSQDSNTLKSNYIFKRFKSARGTSLVGKWFRTQDPDGRDCRMVLFVDKDFEKASPENRKLILKLDRMTKLLESKGSYIDYEGKNVLIEGANLDTTIVRHNNKLQVLKNDDIIVE